MPDGNGAILQPRLAPGFTLVEVIIVLVLCAIAGAALLQFMGTAYTNSGVPVQRLKEMLASRQILENIIADYENRKAASEANLLANIKSAVGTTGSQSNNYGQYEVLYNDFIKFESGSEAPIVPGTDPADILKVRVRGPDGAKLSTLLTAE